MDRTHYNIYNILRCFRGDVRKWMSISVLYTRFFCVRLLQIAVQSIRILFPGKWFENLNLGWSKKSSSEETDYLETRRTTDSSCWVSYDIYSKIKALQSLENLGTILRKKTLYHKKKYNIHCFSLFSSLFPADTRPPSRSDNINRISSIKNCTIYYNKIRKKEL